MSSANVNCPSVFEFGTPDFYLFTDPKTLNYAQYSELFKKWKQAVPHWKIVKGMSNRELAQFILHFVNGRLFLGEDTRDWMFVDEKEILESPLVYDRAFNLVSNWLKVAEGKLLSGENKQIVEEEGEKDPNNPQEKEFSEIKWIKSAVSALDSGRSSEGLASMLRKEMLFGAGRSSFGQMKPDEKAVKVIDEKTGRLSVYIYNFTSMLMRKATSQDDISSIGGMNFPLTLAQASEDRIKNSKTYKMFANLFCEYKDPDKEIALFWKFFSECFILGNSDEIIINWTGKSGTGKSAIENTLHVLLGEKDVLSVDSAVYELHSKEKLYQRADLDKKRVAIIPEVRKGRILDCDLLKRDTSMVINARNAGLRPVNFRRTHVLLLMGNDAIRLSTLAGAERRFFNVKTDGLSVYPYLNKPGEVAPKIEDMVKVMTQEELDVFLTLVSMGRKDRIKNGLEIPKLNSFAVEGSSVGNCSQIYQDFVEYAVMVGDIRFDMEKEFVSKDLYELFREWFIYVNKGREANVPVDSVFGRLFVKQVFTPTRESNGKRYYKGLEISEISAYQYSQAEKDTKRMMFVDKGQKRGDK